MIEIIINIIKEIINLWTAMAPYLLLGMFIAGILHVFIGTAFISRHLGDDKFSTILKATLFGIPLPICSCGVIPVAASLKKDGASKSATLSFLVSTPTTGVDSVLASYALLGPLFAIFRPLAAFVTGITIGTLNFLFNREIKAKPKNETPHPHQSPKIQNKFKEVLKYGFFELAEDIGKWLVIGVVIGGILTVAIPQEFITEFLPYTWLHFLVMLILAVPLYVCATGSIPIAAAIIQKGFTPGAALVFLIAGPATNAVTLSFVRSKLGKRAFYLYLISIVTVAVLAGVIFNFVWLHLGGNINLISGHGEHISPVFRYTTGAILAVLILIGFIKKDKKEIQMQYEFTVFDMTCKHCKMTIENTLTAVPGISQVAINVDSKTVGVNGDISSEKIEETIRAAGYTPQLKSEK